MVTLNLLLIGFLVVALGGPVALAILAMLRQELFVNRRNMVLMGISVGYAILCVLGAGGLAGLVLFALSLAVYFASGLLLRYAVFGFPDRIVVDLPPRPQPMGRWRFGIRSILQLVVLLAVTAALLRFAYNSTMYFERQQSDTEFLDLYEGIESDID